ncbi:hypothetical protein N7G274_001827 [Stereocaulon virgatum]|uniref:Uncharacterized protein n=1 Tax=Stereocaulon virgatum TaxID=373712 RepID=A0ABR4AMC8_9LECA
MKKLLWMLAIVADVIHAYPGQLSPRQQSISSNGLPINGSFSNGLFPTVSVATGSRASGIIFFSSVTPSGSSISGSSSSLSPKIDSSTVVPMNNNTGSSTSTPSASPTPVSSNGSLITTPTTTSSSSNGTAISGILPISTASTGTGTTPIGITSSFSLLSVSSAASSSLSTTPSGTITSAASLSTISIVSLSTQSTSIVGVTSNTEITTDDNGHHTIVPFLWGCWFCGGGGLLLWGVGPLPGIYPPPAPPPFPSWPVITIGNDNIPTPEPSKGKPTDTSPSKTDTSPSTTATVTSSSSFCTGSTITDYWVSCASAASGTTSSCSTYSSSLAFGCSLTPITTTTVSSCTAPASVDSGNLLPGEMAGAEYDFVDPRVSEANPQWTYTVAILASTGIVSGPTSRSTPTTLISSTSPPATTTESPPLCIPFQDPKNGVTGYCQCSSGSFLTTTPFQTSTNNPCGYTTLSIPTPTLTMPPTTTNNNPYPFTTTDTAGDVVACASSSLSYLAVAGGLTFTLCDGSSTTVSTAPPKPSSTSPPPPPPPPPPPSADCAFWDMGWGWQFEVYNINGWSTDGGDGLHHQENGCGALTGWSWASKSSGGQAYFNLDFFIKSGCVERAIASAGGPKISCKSQGIGKRAADIKPRADAATPAAKPPNFNNKAVADAYNPPDVDITTVSHTYEPETWDHTTRSLERSELHERNLLLNKRGCIPSKPVATSPGGDSPPPALAPLICNPVIPGVDECNAQIRTHGNVGHKTSLFYTGWGSNGAPGTGGTMTRKYATKYMCGMDTVSWTGLCDGDWRFAVQKAIVEPFKRPGMNNDELFALEEKADPFLKNLSQAFAETSKGDVYVFIPEGQLPNNQWNLDSAWGGWEYPALTKNTDVQRIWRVDLDLTNHEDPKGTPRVIFDRSKGNGPAYEPKGIRGPSLPAGLPADQVPANWDQPSSL